MLRQFVEAVKDRLGDNGRSKDGTAAAEVKTVKEDWLREWMPKLTSDEVPMTPYRVIWDLMKTVSPGDAIVTHDSGSPRDQIVPFYQAAGPRSYLGWGKSHGLGTGLGLTIGAKLAAPDKLAIHWMGDCGIWHGGTGLRNRGAVWHTHSGHSFQQLHHGCGGPPNGPSPTTFTGPGT